MDDFKNCNINGDWLREAIDKDILEEVERLAMLEEPRMERKVDFLGNELNVGDEVIFMNIGYRTLMIGKIVKMNPKKATIDFKKPNNTHNWQGQTFQFYNQLIKKDR